MIASTGTGPPDDRPSLRAESSLIAILTDDRTGAVPTLPAGVGPKSSQLPGPVPSTSTGAGMTHPLAGAVTHPYRHPLLSGNYDEDYPLRKTGTLLSISTRNGSSLGRQALFPVVCLVPDFPPGI